MGNQARASNAWLCVCIALYVLLGAARFLHNSHLQRFTPFISVTILMGFAIVHGFVDTVGCIFSSFSLSPSSSAGVMRH